jgi:hypothetical protein
VAVNTSLTLADLKILPNTGTLDVLSPVTAFAFASVFDSFTGLNPQQSDSENDTAASATVATALAAATGEVSALELTASASSMVNISAVNAFAGTNDGPIGGGLLGFFQITDKTGNENPVNVTFSATLNIKQSLKTDLYGLNATSEVTFSLLLPDIDSNPFLFLDNPLQIGSGNSFSSTSSPMLTGTAAMMTNTPYFLFVQTDAESTGLNSTPEPSYFPPAAILCACIGFLSGRHRRGSRFHNGPGKN